MRPMQEIFTNHLYMFILFFILITGHYLLPLSFNAVLKFMKTYSCNFLDLDECHSPDSCGVDHVCNNTVGSYRCECLTGFVPDSGAQDPLNPVCVGKRLSCPEEGNFLNRQTKNKQKKQNVEEYFFYSETWLVHTASFLSQKSFLTKGFISMCLGVGHPLGRVNKKAIFQKPL